MRVRASRRHCQCKYDQKTMGQFIQASHNEPPSFQFSFLYKMISSVGSPSPGFAKSHRFVDVGAVSQLPGTDFGQSLPVILFDFQGLPLSHPLHRIQVFSVEANCFGENVLGIKLALDSQCFHLRSDHAIQHVQETKVLFHEQVVSAVLVRCQKPVFFQGCHAARSRCACKSPCTGRISWSGRSARK